MQNISTRFTQQVGIEFPIICGAMFPCSNVELVAAVSQSGGIGIVQPMSLTYVYGFKSIKEGLVALKQLTNKPFGINVILENTSDVYRKRAEEWVDVGLEMGCRFFITALGNPEWVIKKVKAQGGVVYHDITEKKWALKALEHNVDGLICVNNRAGGHAGRRSPKELIDSLAEFNIPLICAGGIGDENAFIEALELGYDGVQMGTRFIATYECREKKEYKNAIIQASPKDIVLTERVTGIPLSVIKTPYVEKIGTKVSFISSWLLKNRWTKNYMRAWYWFRAFKNFKRISLKGGSSQDYWQAGKSVEGIHSIEHVEDIIKRFVEAKTKGIKNNAST